MARLLRRGDRDVAVGEIRAKLSLIGFPVECSEPDFFDDRMDQAVRAFQQARGLNIDGIIGPHTLQRIDEARWSLGDRPLSFTPGHLSHGDDDISLQQRLSTMGFDAGKVDGIFGVRTEAALKEFQRSVGVEVDGIAGTETFAALKRLNRTVSGGQAEKLRHSAWMDSVRTGVRDKTIVIDPGHGGDDAGVCANNIREVDVVSAIAARLQGRLAAHGATVVLTRPLQNPTDATDAERASLANDVDADLLISLHCDAATSPNAAGVAAFHYGSPSSGWSHIGERAAMRIHSAVLSRSFAEDCKVHGRTWDILRLTRMAAVRLDVGYVTNESEAAALGDPAYQDQLAAGICDGIVKFFEPVA